MRDPHPSSRGVAVRLAAFLAVLMLATLPVVSGYLSDDKDEQVMARSCFPCHGPAEPDDVTIVLRAPTQVAYSPENESVVVEVGILGEPENVTAFGMMLNASEDATGVRWDNRFGNYVPGTELPRAQNRIRAREAILFSAQEIGRRWFNVSFKPGNIDQELELTVIGMRANGNGNESGDSWAVLEGHMIEVREQRLLTLNVTVSNDEPIGVSDVVVDFFIDDDFIGQAKVPNIPGNSKENASIEWDVTFVEDGKYLMRGEIDPDGNLTETDRSNNVVTRTIWLGGPPEPEDRSVLYSIGALVAVVVVAGVVYYLYRRRLYRF